MNNYIWFENSYLLPEKDSGSDLKGKCHSARTRDGKQVYVFKEGFENLPEDIKEAFKNLSEFKEFQNKTWTYICRDRRAENMKRLLPVDILGVIAGYLDESTKVAFSSASQHLKKYAAKSDFQDICENAAGRGYFEILKWARTNGAPWNSWTCANAAKGGHLEVLKWARANGAPWNGATCANAARGGHLEVLKWARANGALWDDRTCANAARGGYLEVLKWAHANGAPWDQSTCAYAAMGGHLEVLKWARANGAPWDDRTCAYAATENHLEVLKWARMNGAPWNIDLIRSYANPEILEWLMRNP
jgi:hypothetical protein